MLLKLLNKFLGTVKDELVALAKMCPQPFFNVAPYMLQGFAAVLEVEIANPAADGGVDCSHNQIKRHKCSLPLRESANSIFDRLQRLLRWLDVCIALARPSVLPIQMENPRKSNFPS